jgi:hypothetical protein
MLRTCLVLAALLAPNLSHAGEAEAIARVRKLGGLVIKRSGEVIVDLGATNTGDEDLPVLAHIDGVRIVNLNGTRVTDAGMKSLAALPHLESVYLPNTAVSDAGLKALARNRGLKFIELRDTKVTEAGVAEARKLLPRCDIIILRTRRRLRTGPAPLGPPPVPERAPARRFEFRPKD